MSRVFGKPYEITLYLLVQIGFCRADSNSIIEIYHRQKRNSMNENVALDRYLRILRDKTTHTSRFRWAADNLARLLCSQAIAKLPHRQTEVETPVGVGSGAVLDSQVMCVPIYRAGQALVPAFLEVLPEASVGSLLIQRDEKTALPMLIYQKFPPILPPFAIILDPMLATAGSAKMAVEILLQHGYTPKQLYFVGVIASSEGFEKLSEVIPSQHITVCQIDPHLTVEKFIDPGLGDFGDRYFGTI